MTTQRDFLLQEIKGIRSELERLLDGIDYCFDWKPDSGEWSARELVYHLVDTPSGGIHNIVKGVLEERLQEFSIEASLTNLTEERSHQDLNQAKTDVEDLLTSLEKTLSLASDGDLTERKATVHSITRSTTDERTAGTVIGGIFVRHWREHLEQLAALRDALGLE